MNEFIKIGFPEYLALPYMSVHGLKLFESDPIAFLLSFQGVSEEAERTTPALDMGKAFHCRILESGAYYDTVACMPDVSKVSKEGKAIWSDFEAANKGKTWLKREVAEEIEFMAASVMANPQACKLLEGGQSEMSGLWYDDRGFMCKIRPDKIKIDEYEGIADIIDLKTFNGDLGGQAVGREITNRLYHWQDYFYCKGIKAILPVDQARFNFIFTSKTWPYRTRVFTLNKDKVMTEAGERIEAILDDYAEFVKQPIEDLFSKDDGEILYLPPWAA
jgi:hypothetical protein